MKKKRGFTLIELLAVIVILAIIALIAIPIILNMVNQARKAAAIDTAYGYVESVEYAMGLSDIEAKGYENINIKDQEYDITDEDLANIKIKGRKPDSGTITIEKRTVKEGHFCIDEFKVDYVNKVATAVKSNECKGGSSEEESTEEAVVPDKVPCELETETKDNKTYYYIDSVEDMYAFSESVNGGNNYSGKTVVLRNSLDFSNYTSDKKSKVCSNNDNTSGFTPIGTSTTVFSGSFEGNGRTIKNLTINRPNQDYVGIFGYVSNGTIKGLNVDNAKITGKNYVATIVGYSSPGLLKELVINSADVKGNYAIGGISNLAAVSGNEVNNVIIYDIKLDGSSSNAVGTGYASFYTNVVVGKGTITGTSSAFSYDTNRNLFYTSDVKVNDTTAPENYIITSNDTKDVNFYESIGFDTWIGGDNDGSGYYFDYENSTSNKVVIKPSSNLPTNIDNALDKNGDYYLIKNISDWKKATVFANGNHKFQLANNLDFKGKHFYMLGSNSVPFTGTFDGQVKTISNVNVTATKGSYIGIIGKTQGSTTIKGLIVDKINMLGNTNVALVVGSAAPADINEIVIKSGTTKGNSTVSGLANLSAVSGNNVHNILIKNVTVEGASSNIIGTGYLQFYNNIFVEKGTVTGTGSAFSYENNRKIFYTEDAKVNNSTVDNNYLVNEASSKDINFFESIGLDTWIGGDNDNSGYYFDYESSSSNDIVLKSTKSDPIPTNVDSTFEKSGNYYLIENIDDWKKMSAFVGTTKKFKLANDMNFSGKKYYMLGSEFNIYKSTLDGGAKTISNITINAQKGNYIGLFGYVNSYDQTSGYSSIYGFNIKNINITGNTYVGTIVGYSNPANIYEVTIDNSTIKGNNYVGGVSGYLPPISGNEVNNILIKNLTINGNSNVLTISGGYAQFFENVIIEKETITGSTASYTSGTNIYNSELINNNGSLNTSGFNKDNIDDLTYYSGKIETLLNGDSNNSGYYFDYDIDRDGVYIVKSGDKLGWKLLTKKTPKENQKWTYYQTNGNRIADGWGRQITDLSGNLQDYYFENGLAIKGWKTIDNKKYYFSEKDADDNGYIDFNKVYGGDVTIGNRTYTFDNDGVCISSNCNE